MFKCQIGRSGFHTPRPATLRSMAKLRQFKGGPGDGQSDNSLWRKVSVGTFAGLLAVCSGLAHAGLTPELQYWKASPSGTVTEAGLEFDIEEDLRMQEETILGLGLHWGDVFARFQQLTFTGTGDVTVDTVFLGIPLGSQTRTVSSRVDLDEWSVGWMPLAWKGWRLGIAGKRINGILDAEEQDSIGSYTVDETFPLAALDLVIPLGDSGVQIAADGMWISQGDNTVYEYQFGVENAGPGLRAAGGFRRQRYDIVDGNEALDARIDGFFASVAWEF